MKLRNLWKNLLFKCVRSYSWFILFWLNFTIHSSVHWREGLFRFSVRLLDKGKKFIWRILKPNLLPLWNSSRMFIYEKFFFFWKDSAFWQKSRIWNDMIYIQRIFIIITYVLIMMSSGSKSTPLRDWTGVGIGIGLS